MASGNNVQSGNLRRKKRRQLALASSPTPMHRPLPGYVAEIGLPAYWILPGHDETSAIKANDSVKRVLILGDGNFSFTYALIMRYYIPRVLRHSRNRHILLANSLAMIGTVFETRENHRAKYFDSQILESKINEHGGVTLFGVNAANLVETLENAFEDWIGQHNTEELKSAKLDMRAKQMQYCLETVKKCYESERNAFQFDFIFFNHPHSGVDDMQRHRAMLCHFFWNIRKVASHDCLVIIALCDTQPETWKLVEAAAMHGFKLKKKLPIDHGSWPEWVRRRHQRDEDFSKRIQQEWHFVFELNNSAMITLCDNQISNFEDAEHMCTICGTYFDEQAQRKQHMSLLRPVSCEEQLIFSCSMCKKYFASQRALHNHNNDTHEDSKFANENFNAFASID